MHAEALVQGARRRSSQHQDYSQVGSQRMPQQTSTSPAGLDARVRALTAAPAFTPMRFSLARSGRARAPLSYIVLYNDDAYSR